MSRPAASGEGCELVVVNCSECSREADARFTIAEQWAWWSDGFGALLPFCPECARREFEDRITLAHAAHTDHSEHRAA